jgi:hypothetical protein
MTSTNFNPYLTFRMSTPVPANEVDHSLVVTRPPTPAPDESAGNTLAPPFSPKPGETDPSHHIIPLYKSPGLEVMWNHFLQLSLQESNGGLAAKDYLVVQAVSPFYPKDRTGRLAWFIMWPGPAGRITSSSETRLKTGATLCLEDSAISSYLPTEEYPINYVRMKKPLWREPGHVIYEITSDLFSRFRYPRPERPPTRLIAIPYLHAHEEGMNLPVYKPSFNQRVQPGFTGLALPPLRIWDEKQDIIMPEVKNNLSWYEEMEEEIGRKESQDHAAMQG